MPYPILNRADSLEVDFHAIRRAVGKYMGYGYSHQEWDDEMAEEVQDIIDEGVRQAYYPPPLPEPHGPDSPSVHEWTFMRPTFEFETQSGQRRYYLPEDFERVIGTVAYTDTDNAYSPIQLAPPGRLRAMEARTDYTSPPSCAAIEPEDSDGSGTQRLVLVLHPTPDAVYSLALTYQAYGKRLTEEAPIPLGGQAFGPVVMASCLLAAEMHVLRQTGGPMHSQFQQRLAGAIARDQQRSPALLGYNGDSSGDFIGRGSFRRTGMLSSQADATYNGVAYTG
jgi:hypothetical protein